MVSASVVRTEPRVLGRHYLAGFFALALAVRLVTAWPIRDPGYTDAYYYAVGARQLDSGHGFEEPFIWNYLDPPAAVPHPGFQYWMPLAAILGWAGLALFGTFQGMQAPFILLAALLPLVAYGVAWDLTRRHRHARLAALLAVFPGFYAHVLVVPDNFAPFALAGSICLWAAGRGLRDRRPAWFGLAGLAAGMAHLARADGLLLAAVALLSAAGLAWPSSAGSRPGEHAPRRALATAGLALAGYLAVVAPWLARNWLALGTPLPGAGASTLFLTTYDDMFAYGRPLTAGHYLAWGWAAILRSKADALLLNLQRVWVENLLVFLLPFTAVGLWRLKPDRLLWPFFIYAPALFLAMTLAFTFPGTRGGLFHSAGAWLPFLFAAAGPGLESLLRWLARRLRGWNAGRAWPVFAAGLVALAVFVSAIAVWRAGIPSGAWAQRGRGYAQVGAWLSAHDVPAGAVIMAGNAPGLTWQTGYRSVAIPNEPVDTILAVARHYGAQHLVLDEARPRSTDPLYSGRARNPRLALRHTVQIDGHAWQIYEIGR